MPKPIASLDFSLIMNSFRNSRDCFRFSIVIWWGYFANNGIKDNTVITEAKFINFTVYNLWWDSFSISDNFHVLRLSNVIAFILQHSASVSSTMTDNNPWQCARIELSASSFFSVLYICALSNMFFV